MKGPPPLGGSGGTVAGDGGFAGSAGSGLAGTGGTPAPEPSCDRISTAAGQFNPCGNTDGIAYSRDGALLAIATDTRPPNVHVYRLPGGSLVQTLDGISQRAMTVAFSPDGSILAAAGELTDTTSGVNQPDIVKLYDLKTGSTLRTLPVSCGFYADSVAFSSDGALLATAGYMGAVEVWRVSDGTRVTKIDYPNSVHNVHFAPNDSAIIVGGYDKRATVWEVPTGKLLLELSPTTDEMADAAFSPDGSQIATTGPNNVVQIWDGSNGKLLQQVTSHQAYVSHVLWLDQDHIVSNDWSGVITWMTRQPSGDFAVGTSWTTPSQSLGIAISPDRTMLAAGTGQKNALGFEFFAIDPKHL